MIHLRACIVTLLLGVPTLAQPARIVSTFPSITETFFALGAGDRVVGVSNYCRYPPAVLSLPKVGTYTKPDPEKIALLRPDLVIIQKSAAALADRLSCARHPARRSEDGISGRNLFHDPRYRSRHGSARQGGEAQRRYPIPPGRDSRARHVGKPRPDVLIMVGRTPGLLTSLIAVGPGPYLGELLEIAGGSNVLTGTAIAYPQISLETVVRLNPDVILDTSIWAMRRDASASGSTSSGALAGPSRIGRRSETAWFSG